MGNGHRGHCLPLWKGTGAALHGWLGSWPQGADRHLFLRNTEAAVTTRGFAKHLVVHAETAAAPAIADKTAAPLSRRHVRVTNILESTSNARRIAQWPGQSSRQTTFIRLPINPAEELRILLTGELPEIQQWCIPGTGQTSGHAGRDRLTIHH